MEIQRTRRTLLEGGGKKEVQAKRSWMGKSYPCWGNGPEGEVAGADELGVIDGGRYWQVTGARPGKRVLWRGVWFFPEVHKP